ncbi:MAG: hypothetical protein FE034_00845 [Thermoplasmata archaeon]|nr:MAG: hypothetical protein FE034_00845 [Thermoplasmata archaeon]
MKVVDCIIEMRYNDKKTAENILKSVKVDDYNFVDSQLKDNTIVAQISAGSIPSLLHTLDDYLSCLSIAEKIVNKH